MAIGEEVESGYYDVYYDLDGDLVQAQISNSATANTITTHSTLARLRIGMTMNEAIEIIGFVGKSIGNGTIIHEYCVDQSGTACIVYCLDTSGTYRISEIIWEAL